MFWTTRLLIQSTVGIFLDSRTAKTATRSNDMYVQSNLPYPGRVGPKNVRKTKM